MALWICEERDVRLGRHLGERHEDFASRLLHLLQHVLWVVGVDVELHARRLALAGRTDTAGNPVSLAIHAVPAGIVGVQAPAEDIAVEPLQTLTVTPGDLDVDDLCRHGNLLLNQLCWERPNIGPVCKDDVRRIPKSTSHGIACEPHRRCASGSVG